MIRLQANDDAFFPYFTNLDTGEVVEIPRVSLLKDHLLRHRILQAVSKSPNLGMLLQGSSIQKSLSLALGPAKQEELTELVGIVLEKSADWVDDHLNVGEQIQLLVDILFTPTDPDDESRVDSGEVWTFAGVLDFFAKEYSWTVDEVLSRSRWELKALLNAVEDRYEKEIEAMKKGPGSRSRDRLMSGGKGWHEVNVPKRRRRVKEDGKPDWDKATGGSNLMQFAQATGMTIKQESVS